MPSLSLENRATNDKARVKALQLFLISHKANESEAGWGPGNGLIDGDSEVTQPGTDGFLKSTYTDNDGVIHSSIDGDFGPATDAAVKAFQQAMVEGNAGVDLGSTGPNQDGVDGKVGTKTGGIVEAALTKVGHQITADLETQVAKANAAAAAAAAAPAAAAAAAAASVSSGSDHSGAVLGTLKKQVWQSSASAMTLTSTPGSWLAAWVATSRSAERFRLDQGRRQCRSPDIRGLLGQGEMK